MLVVFFLLQLTLSPLVWALAGHGVYNDCHRIPNCCSIHGQCPVGDGHCLDDNDCWYESTCGTNTDCMFRKNATNINCCKLESHKDLLVENNCYEYGIMYASIDSLNTLTTNDVQECGDICNNNSSCVYAQYEIKTSVCQIKNEYEYRPDGNSTVIVYHKYCYPGCTTETYNYLGGIITGAITVQSIDQCMLSCQLHSNCTMAIFGLPETDKQFECSLRSIKAIPKRDRRFVSVNLRYCPCPKPHYPSVFSYGDRHYYVSSDKQTLEQANLTCAKMGMTFPEIRNPADLQSFKAVIPDGITIPLGMTVKSAVSCAQQGCQGWMIWNRDQTVVDLNEINEITSNGITINYGKFGLLWNNNQISSIDWNSTQEYSYVCQSACQIQMHCPFPKSESHILSYRGEIVTEGLSIRFSIFT